MRTPSLLAEGRDSDWTRGVSLLESYADEGPAAASQLARPRSRLRGPLAWMAAVLLLLMLLIGLHGGDAVQAPASTAPRFASARPASAPPAAGLAGLAASVPQPASQVVPAPVLAQRPLPELQALAADTATLATSRATPAKPAAARAASKSTGGSRASTAASREDPDVELLSALMSHQDRKAAASRLPAAERRAFSQRLRKCSAGTIAASERCRRQACEAQAYWGRTPSCPANRA